MPGLGRGAPGTAGALGAGRPMPVEPPNGLLPGRGAAGRPMPVEPPKGLLPGRGPAGRGASGLGAGAAACTGAASGAAVTATAGAAAAAGSSCLGSTTGAATGAGTAAGLAAGFFAAGFAGAAAAGMASLSLRATGGSTVDDADFTNSPNSASLASTSLLVTPSSFASSWTRTFDTFLLSSARVIQPEPSVRTTHD